VVDRHGRLPSLTLGAGLAFARRFRRLVSGTALTVVSDQPPTAEAARPSSGQASRHAHVYGPGGGPARGLDQGWHAETTGRLSQGMQAVSELNEMGCAGFAGVTAELALGVPTGRERAEAMAHLDRCTTCQENVRQLTVTGEGLLRLLPAVEPPPGFETRVLERLGPRRAKSGPGVGLSRSASLVSEADFIAAQDVGAARGPEPRDDMGAPERRRYLLAVCWGADLRSAGGVSVVPRQGRLPVPPRVHQRRSARPGQAGERLRPRCVGELSFQISWCCAAKLEIAKRAAIAPNGSYLSSLEPVRSVTLRGCGAAGSNHGAAVAGGRSHRLVPHGCSLGSVETDRPAQKLGGAMHDVGGCGGGQPGGSGIAGDQQSGQPGGGHSGGVHSSRPRDPYQDPLDPRGPMGMPKIVSRAANRLGHGQWGGGDVAAGIYALSVLAIIIALGIFFIAGGH
jgi:hypothetical protein